MTGGIMTDDPNFIKKYTLLQKYEQYQEMDILRKLLEDKDFLKLSNEINKLAYEILANKKRIEMIKLKTKPYTFNDDQSDLLIHMFTKSIDKDIREIGVKLLKIIVKEFPFSEDDKKYIKDM